jgi:hypothetical protein
LVIPSGRGFPCVTLGQSADSLRCVVGVVPCANKSAILGMGNEPTDETAFSNGGSLIDLAEGTEERENDGTVRSPARS